jgi:Raf kinase inhibitor-like YbhB/YbcL family protein
MSDFIIKNFVNRESFIKDKYTCSRKGYGDNISPAMSWKKNSKCGSYALIFEDIGRDGKPFHVHWYVPYISCEINEIDELRNSAPINYPDKFIQGKNSYEIFGYIGPCPPSNGSKHMYRFILYELRGKINLSNELLEPMFSTDFEKVLKKQKIQILKKNIIDSYFSKD